MFVYCRPPLLFIAQILSLFIARDEPHDENELGRFIFHSFV